MKKLPKTRLLQLGKVSRETRTSTLGDKVEFETIAMRYF